MVRVRTAFLESPFRRTAMEAYLYGSVLLWKRTAMEDDLIIQYLLLLILFFSKKIGLGLGTWLGVSLGNELIRD